MMKPGKSHSTANTAPFQPGVVIAAEIVFAALLLYLTNHPIEINALDTASVSPSPDTHYLPADQDNNISAFQTSAASVAVAARTLDTRQQTRY